MTAHITIPAPGLEDAIRAVEANVTLVSVAEPEQREWIENHTCGEPIGFSDSDIVMRFDGETYSAILRVMDTGHKRDERFTGYGSTVAQAQSRMFDLVDDWRLG